MSAPEKLIASTPGIGADVAAISPAWLVCLAVDPTSAAIVGLPLAAAAIAIRRRLWPTSPIRGRVVVGIALPFAAIAVSAVVGLGSLSAIVPWLVAAAPIAVLERRLERRGRSLVARFPLVTGAVFAVLALALDLLLLTWNVIEYPLE